MDATGGPAAGAAQEELLTALRHLEQVARDGVVPEELGDDELLILLADAEAVGRLADGLRVLGAGVVAERSRPSLGEQRLSARRGCRTPAELVERTTRVSGATARQRIRAAAPVQTTAALSGELLPARFPLVRRGWRRVSCHWTRPAPSSSRWRRRSTTEPPMPMCRQLRTPWSPPPLDGTGLIGTGRNRRIPLPPSPQMTSRSWRTPGA